jgi:glycosyltransferase involved in cell wall biosynthesis
MWSRRPADETYGLRVDLVIDNLGSGGAQRQVVELARTLRGTFGVDARIVAYRHVSSRDVDVHGARIAAASLPVSVVAKRRKLDPRHPARLARALAGADIVQSYMPIPSLWTRAALAWLPAHERPRWIACERTDPTQSPWLHDRLRVLAFGHADLVVANSRCARTALESMLGVPSSRLAYLPNGIDLVSWDHAAARPPPWPMRADRFHVVIVGRLSSEKNHALLLEAIARLSPELRRDCRVWFLGASTSEREGGQVVRQTVERLGLEDTVEFRPPTAEVAALLARAHLLVLPSRFEGFPNVVLEAMASRTLVLAAPVGDVPALIDEGRTGLLFRAGDVDDLARKIVAARALAQEVRESIVEAARARVEAHHRIEAVARRYVCLYESLLRAPFAGVSTGDRDDREASTAETAAFRADDDR